MRRRFRTRPCCTAVYVAASILTILAFTSSRAADMPGSSSLWYETPARRWGEALPIGNGRLGGMVFGGVADEHIQFNEDSLWIGDEEDTGSYQAFGDPHIELSHKEATSYRRELDLSNAVHTINYASGGIRYQREYFASYPAQVMVLHFTADRKGAYTGKVRLTNMHRGTIVTRGNRIVASGSLAGYVYRKSKKTGYAVSLRYEAQVLVLNQGGTIRSEGNEIAFENVDSLKTETGTGTLMLAAQES